MKKRVKKTLKNFFKMSNAKEENNKEKEASSNEANIETNEQTETTNVAEENKITEESEEPTQKPDECAELQTKIDELNDKYLRLYSEFDNYRKRTVKEKVELIKTAGEDIFKILLPVLDDFERGMKSINEASNIDSLKEGVNLIYHKLKTTLIQKGLQEMAAHGEPFNSDIHEAITNIPAPSEDLKGKVVDELEKGYLLNGKVIRYAKVVVGN